MLWSFLSTDNVAPDRVWVLEVYLTPQEAESLSLAKRDLTRSRTAYDEMTPDPTLLDNTATFSSRFQPATPAAPARSTSRTSKKSGKSSSSGSPWRTHLGRSRGLDRGSSSEDYYNILPVVGKPPPPGGAGVEESTRLGNVTISDTTSSTVSVSFHKKKASRDGATTDRATVPARATDVGPSVTGGARQKVDVGRSRIGSDREMPQLHGRSEGPGYHERSYDEISSTELEQTQSEQQTPPAFISKEAPSSIPVSLSIPIPEGGLLEGGLGVPVSSSGEEERFATPSPNLRVMYANQQPLPPQASGDGEIAPAFDRSSCVDRSSSSKTTGEPLKLSRSPSPIPRPASSSNLDTGVRVPSIYDTLPLPPLPSSQPAPATATGRSPPAPVSPPGRPARPQLEESGDFVDSSVLDQIIHEARQQNMLLGSLQHAPLGAREGGGSEEESDEEEVPPALPPRNYGSDDESLAPRLPPRRNQQLQVEKLANVEVFGGNSGEFTVVGSSSAVPRGGQSSGGAEYGAGEVEYTPPPSPPPRTLSQRGNHTPPPPLLALAAVSGQDEADDDDRPPTPPPKETTETTTEITVTREGDFVGERWSNSASSSPDHQHRDLTQQEEEEEEYGRASSAEGGTTEDDVVRDQLGENRDIDRGGDDGQSVEVNEGQDWEEEEEGKSDVTSSVEDQSNLGSDLSTEIVRKRRSSSSVDPVKPEDSESTLADDETASGTSAVRTLTSDEEEEEEEDEELTLSLSAAAIRYKRQPSVSTPTEGGERTHTQRERERGSEGGREGERVNE